MSGYKKILLISTEFPPGPGGIGNHGYNLAKYLKKNNYDVTVYTVSDYAGEKEIKEFDAEQLFKIFRFKRFKSRVKTFKNRISKILQSVKKNNYSHIIFSGRFALISSLFLRNCKKKIKFIAIAHGGDINAENGFEKILVDKALMRMDLIIPVSNYSRSKLNKNIKTKRIIVIPNGFDFEDIDGLKINGSILDKEKLNLITIGTVWPRKGHHNVLNALPELMKTYPEIKYNIIGRLADLSKVEKYFQDNNIKDHLNIAGFISSDEMHVLLNQSQIFILLSEIQSSGDFEGFGIAVIEANYFGLPAIGSKNSGLEDSINNGVSGIIVDPRNPVEISEAVKKIMNNYSEFSIGAKKWSLQHHWSNIVKRYITALEGIN